MIQSGGGVSSVGFSVAEMARGAAYYSSLSVGGVNFSNPGFPAVLDELPVAYLSNDVVADSYETILSVSGGGGRLLWAFGAKVSPYGNTCEFRVTVDGVVSEIEMIAPESYSRCFLGPVGVFTGNGFGFGGVDYSLAQSVLGYSMTMASSAYVFSFPTPLEASLLGSLGVRFERSLIVEYKQSSAVTGERSRERGCCYVLD